MIGNSIKPNKAEYLLLSFVFLNIVANLHSYWNGELFWSSNSNYNDPYTNYNNNTVIQIITFLTLLLNVIIMALIIGWQFYQKGTKVIILSLIALCIVGSLMTWTELWYGSTFYYGEVRDKQGLPFGINNGGIAGSFVFIFYGLSKFRITHYSIEKRKTYLIVVGIILIILHYIVWRLVYESWNLFQS